MEQWSEIRRRVLVEGVSRRQILRETGMHWQTLRKILEHSQPPGYRHRSGTDPTNPASVFRATEAAATNGWTLTWPAAPGRTYRLSATDDLATNTWTLIAGPWTATNGQTHMQHTLDLPPAATNRTHRIECLTP